MDVLQRLEIQVMEWPAMSPNLNPIKSVWDMLYRHVCGHSVAPQTLQELEHALNEDWEWIPLIDLHRLIRRMPRRVGL